MTYNYLITKERLDELHADYMGRIVALLREQECSEDYINEEYIELDDFIEKYFQKLWIDPAFKGGRLG